MPRTLVLSMRSACLGVVFALAACTSYRTDDQAAVTGAVNDLLKDYAASLNSGNLDRWVALWTEDGVQLPPGEPAVIGKDRIRTRNGAGLDRFKFDMDIKNEELRVAGDWAYIRGTYTATLKPKQGGDPALVDGKYMSILAKQPDGSWKFHRDAFNSNVANR
jgi:uncharacterized protein (TIGR02246 family)